MPKLHERILLPLKNTEKENKMENQTTTPEPAATETSKETFTAYGVNQG